MKESGSEVAGGSEDSQQTQPKINNPIVSTGRLVKSEQPYGSLTQEIDKGVLVGCESTNVRTGRLVESCVPVSVERWDKDKDADENVDADQISTVRPVESGQPTGSSTQCEEVDIDFRVSGLPHAVVKQAENCRVRELVKKIEVTLIEMHFKPICSKITSTIHSVTNRKRWFVKWAMWSSSSYAKQFQKCNAQNAFFLGIKASFTEFAGISWQTAKPANIFINGDWTLSLSHTTSSRRSDLMVLGTAKPRQRNSISWPTTRARDVSKRILMEFTIVSNEIQHIVIRNSKLAGPRRSASRWTSWHRKTTPIAHQLRS